MAIAAGTRRALAPVSDLDLAAPALQRPAQGLGCAGSARRSRWTTAARLLGWNALPMAIAARTRRALAPVSALFRAARALQRPAQGLGCAGSARRSRWTTAARLLGWNAHPMAIAAG